MSIYTEAVEISPIYGKAEFDQLDHNEKLYAYYFSRASIEGSKICLFEVSKEAPALFALFQIVFGDQSFESLKEAFLKKTSEDNWTKAVTYVGAFLGQLGNYKSFGATKFVPQIGVEDFYTLIESSEGYVKHKEIVNELWDSVKEVIYKQEGEFRKIGIYPNGLTGYYSKNLTEQDIKKADQFLMSIKVSPLNTHVYKKDNVVYVKVCSINKSETNHQFQGQKYVLQYGFLAPFLQRSAENLQKAVPVAANEIQKKMLEAYIKHFQTGDMQLHWESQKQWVQDKGPIVETNLGHVQTYLDPLQVRAYWEGMVAVVDKKASEIVGNLVNNAEKLLQKFIPWPKQFEKDQFLKPDFTSLVVLTFASFDTPRGINIPNYDDIRGDIGFKNVFLANNIVGVTKPPKYLRLEEGELLLKQNKQVAFHSVSYHQLLGHGCGKLLTEKQGKLNFDPSVVNPLTNQKVKTWYKDGETWGTKFKALNNPYQECRADSIALYYSCFQEAVNLLQPEFGENWKDLRDAVWINFANMGVNSLQFYNSEDKRWMQAHSNGRFVILQVMIEAGQNFVKVDKTQKDGKPWIQISIDRSKIETVGLPALKNFLLRLQVYKATADLYNATQMYEGYSTVNGYFLEIKDIVEANKTERHLQIKGNIVQQEEGKFTYLEYPLTFEGLIQSVLGAFPDNDMLETVNVWRELSQFD